MWFLGKVGRDKFLWQIVVAFALASKRATSPVGKDRGAALDEPDCSKYNCGMMDHGSQKGCRFGQGMVREE
jgi:hypothetical protein